MSEQPRDVRGQWAEKSYSDAGQLDLSQGLNLWDEGGTFDYPPQAASLDHLVWFWSTVEVPDSVLDATQKAYALRENREVSQEASRFGLENPYKNFAGTPDQYEAFVKKHLDEWVRERRRTYPGGMPRTWVRSVVRLTKMVGYSEVLPEADREALLDMEVTMPGGRRFQVRGLMDAYRALDLEPAMVDRKREVDVAEAVETPRYI